jgi:hypothetical protein
MAKHFGIESFTAGSYPYLLEYRKIVCIVTQISLDISERRRNEVHAVGLFVPNVPVKLSGPAIKQGRTLS